MSTPRSLTACVIAHAHLMARAGPSKLAKKPLPAVSISRPENRTNRRLTTAWCCWSSSFHRRSPSSASISVERAMSASSKSSRNRWSPAKDDGSAYPGDLPTPKQEAPGLAHGGLKPELPHVHIRHPGGTALLPQLHAPPSDPRGGLAELRARGAAVLRLGSPVGREVLDRERVVPQEASADLGLLKSRLQASNVARR